MTKKQIGFMLVCSIILISWPWLGGGTYLTGVMTVCLIYAIWAVSWDFFSGLTGRENFGFPLLIGVGAYLCGYLNVNYGISPWWGMLCGAALAAIVGGLLGLPTLRLSGPYFALATLTAASIGSRLLLIFWEFTGGEEGIQGIKPLFVSPAAFYYFVLGLAVFTTAFLVGLSRTTWGLMMRAIGGNEAGATAAGVNVTFYKVASLAISAGFAGMGGALYASFQQQTSPQISSVVTLVAVITMVYVGGVGSVYGAAGGAILLCLAGEMLRGLGPYRLLAYSAILMWLLFFMRTGLVAPLWRRLGARSAAVAASLRNDDG